MTQIDALAAAKFNLPPSFPIIWRDDVSWEKARVGRVFNHRRPSRQPLAVVEATRDDHIVEAVRLAHALGTRVSVRSGGHSWAAWSVREGAILVDLGKYHEFLLDESTGVLQASPSMTGRMVNKLLASRGRMFPGGHCPEVALGGFLLQGGMGWNCKNWGFACEKLVAVDVVTADGEKRYCDKNTNADLYWAARGSGPGFPGVVTRFHLQTVPAFSHMRSSIYIYEKQHYKAAFSWVLKLAPTFDESTEIVAVGKYMPGREGEHTMVLFVTFKNSEEEARAALQPAQDSAPPGHVITWFCKPTSLAEQYDDQHSANPEGHRYAVDNCYIRNDADVVSLLKEAFTSLPTKKSFTLWYSMAPGSRRSVENNTMDDMALSIQTDHYFAAYVVWENQVDDPKCQSWLSHIFKEIERESEGAYLGDADFQKRLTRFWAHDQGKRLMDIRRKWDPQGVVAGYLNQGDQNGVNGLENPQQNDASRLPKEPISNAPTANALSGVSTILRVTSDPVSPSSHHGFFPGLTLVVDLQDKPFRCEVCDKAFGRQHAAGHNANESGSKRQKRMSNIAPRVSQACKACAAAKLKCDEDVSCKRCVTKGITCEREARDVDVGDRTSPGVSAQSPTVDQEPSIPPFEPHNQLPFSDHDFSNFLRGVMTPVEGQQGRSLDQVDLSTFDSTFDPLRSQGLLDFRADGDTRFDDVAMGLWDLPCSPSFYYNGIVFEPKIGTVINAESQQSKSTADARPIALGQVAYKESALGMWEPSQRDHINSNIKALSVLGESPQDTIEVAGLEASSQQFSPLSIGLRDQMMLLALNHCKPESKFAIIRAFPTPEILSKLVESFFSHHRVQTDSWLHAPSFEPNQQGPEFLLAIVNAGTTFADSKILHSLGFALHEVVRLSLPNMFEASNLITRMLWALQTFVLEIEMGLWSGIKRKMEIAESQRQMPFTMLRRSGRFGKVCQSAAFPLPEDTGESLKNKWLAWIEQESYNRMAYHSYIMDTQVSISMLTCPLISFSELKAPLPESKDLWLAADAEIWKSIYLRKERQQSRISLSDYFRGSAEIDNSYDVPFCQLIILSGIWGMVWQCLQTIAVLDKPSHSDPALTLRQQEILQSLHQLRVNMPEEETVWQDGPAGMLYELVNMHLHMPFEEVELFAGKGDQNDARRALPLLSDWINSPESRKAIWHAGQLFKVAEKFGPARLRGFYTIALYQANLAMWAYAVVSRVNGTDKDDSRFISRGPPSAAAIQSCVSQDNDVPISVMDQEAVVDHVLSILGANFSHCEAVPPLVENLQQLLDKLGRAATNV
ncbi:hypothetical protein FSARC_13078 [Fusarium sarcochroum]|uniref:FAD-binding PCMH-type domain-containing protein n=1 Tax=Fusarium sarcochroum TaxID=1208366 RepID=A0A8H4T404_9HYPO|nr:hypothetical protein FSARC_13078 [Fusarium sarcochroum]